MKRTEKYRDSYEQDKEYQNQQQRQQHARYQQQRYTNQQQAQYQNNGDRYRQQQARYDENGNRYYNDRDFRREQQLEEDNIRQKSQKWLYIIIALLLIVVAVFVTLAFMGGDSNSDKVSNDPNVSQNYQKQVKDKDDSITSQIEAAKNDIKDKVNTDNTIQKLQQESIA